MTKLVRFGFFLTEEQRKELKKKAIDEGTSVRGLILKKVLGNDIRTVEKKR